MYAEHRLSEFMPFCEPSIGECFGCNSMADPNAACANADPNVPLCVDGECVACTEGDHTACDAQLLVCDTETMSCAPCSEHEQCPSGACDLLLESPTCFDPANVLDVGMGEMFATIAGALTEVGDLALDRAVLRLHGSGAMADFDESAMADTGAIAFIAAEGNSPRWTKTGAMGAPMLTVDGMDTRVYITDVSLSQSTSNSPGFVCNASAVDIRP